MKNKLFTLIITVAITLLSAFALTGCGFFGNGSDNNTEDGAHQDEELSIVEEVAKSTYNTGFNYVSSDVVNKEDVPEEERDFDLENDDYYDVEYKKVKATYSYKDLCAIGVDNGFLYPGAIVDITDNRYKAINTSDVDRAPLTLSANLESMIGVSGMLHTVVAKPARSSVREGIREIVRQNVGVGSSKLPAKISIEMHEVASEREFYMNVGLGLQVSKLNIADNFSYGKIKRQTNLVIVLKQEYYTVDVDNENGRSLFPKSTSNAALNKVFNGTIPAYVDSVSYGRIAFITIQSNYSKSEIQNVLNASWGKMSDNPGSSVAKKLSADFDATLSNMSVDKETDINFFVYGGGMDIGGISPITSNSMNALSSLFESFNAADSVGLPISYKLRDFSGDLIDIYDIDEYTVKTVKSKAKRIVDWSYLDELQRSGEILQESKIKIDLSPMIDYAKPENSKNSAERTIMIPKNIEEFILVGPNAITGNSVTFEKLSLQVLYRESDKPLRIVLSNISFGANIGQQNGDGVAIYSDSNAKIALEIDGIVYIRGAKNAIECKDMEIQGSFGELTILGGAGSDGKNNGDNGASGYMGIKAKSLNVQMKGRLFVYGGNGGNGHAGESFNRDSTNEDQNVHGKNGGNGGEGGAAISVDSLNFTPNCTFIITGGKGGDGGNGGNGQGSHVDEKNGRSGNGGNGGRGGDGGNAIACKNIIVLESDNVESLELTGGAGGVGGDGGHGGNGHVEREWFLGILADKSDYSGNGGNGGNGGDGGFAFYSEFEVTCDSIVINSSASGRFGVGGEGGKCRSNESFNPGSDGINGNEGSKKMTYNLVGHSA